MLVTCFFYNEENIGTKFYLFLWITVSKKSIITTKLSSLMLSLTAPYQVSLLSETVEDTK